QKADDLLSRHPLRLGHRGDSPLVVVLEDPTSLSATVAGPTTRLRPMRSYTTLRDVTWILVFASRGPRVRSPYAPLSKSSKHQPCRVEFPELPANMSEGVPWHRVDPAPAESPGRLVARIQSVTWRTSDLHAKR